MTIGDLLKQYRINQNKTLQEFAGNIIDRSYYGKVERNVHQISAENLINLLRYNQIDATEFIETLDQNYQSQIKSDSNSKKDNGRSILSRRQR